MAIGSFFPAFRSIKDNQFVYLQSLDTWIMRRYFCCFFCLLKKIDWLQIIILPFSIFVDLLTILEYRICRIKKVFRGNILWVKLGVPESCTWDFDIIFIAANWVLGMRLSACLWHFWNSNLAIILFRFLDHPLPISITSTWPYHHKFRAASPQCTVLKFWCLYQNMSPRFLK